MGMLFDSVQSVSHLIHTTDIHTVSAQQRLYTVALERTALFSAWLVGLDLARPVIPVVFHVARLPAHAHHMTSLPFTATAAFTCVCGTATRFRRSLP